MNIDIIEDPKVKDSKYISYTIVNLDNNEEVGYIFVLDNHIAYEIFQKYRRQGIATYALKYITTKLDRPVLEIQINNIPSKKTALKAGYTFIKNEGNFDIYHYDKKKK